MNKLPCPVCKKPLWWNGTRTSPNKFDLEGKRWYQYAAPCTYCKYCGVRLRNPHAGKLLLIAFVIPVIINSLIVQLLAREYRLLILIIYLVVVLAIGAIYWSHYRYEKWDETQPK
jgi:uncharacterized protein YbaR (Trm112 family)